MMQSSQANPQAVNAAWVRYRAIAYLRGKGVSFGVGPEPVFPKLAIDEGKYSLNADVLRHQGVEICDKSFGVLARGVLDHVFVGNRLSLIANPKALLTELIEKLKEGGHLILHMVSPEGAAWMRQLVGELAYWQEKDIYQRDGQLLGIFKLVGRQRRGVKPPAAKAVKRACICRYGAIGDMIMISPLIKQLKQDGYHITMNVTPYCAEVLKHNPHVDNVILQERDAIPNPELGPYWQEWIGDYDKYINLSESIEGKLLKVEGRRDFYTSKQWRVEHFGHVNYFDQTMRLGGYPEALGLKGELHFSPAEERTVRSIRERYKDRFLVLWALRGSSHHKQYPLLEPTLREWLKDKPKALVMLAGSASDAQFAFQHPQVFTSCGVMPLREVFLLTKYADLVAGPETAILNAAGCFPTPKITLLSHSAHDQLCKHWEGDYCLAPENIDCYPCHQLHYSLESCPQAEILTPQGATPLWSGPVCAGMGVAPERLAARLDEVYSLWAASH